MRTFFANSGTETTEAAIKLSRYFTKRQGVIAFFGAFHGRSLGALALTASKAIQRRGFGPFMPGVYHAPYPDVYRFDGSADQCAEQCLAFVSEQIFVHLAGPDEIAAVVVEPIQGEGGYLVPPPAFLHGLRELATRHGMLLVVDEVQSGMGRTGKMFASDHIGLKADIVNIAKGIASGLPLGRDLRPCGRDDVAAGCACQHVRREPGVLRRGQRDDQAAEGVAGRQCGDGREPTCWRASARSGTSTR